MLHLYSHLHLCAQKLGKICCTFTLKQKVKLTTEQEMEIQILFPIYLLLVQGFTCMFWVGELDDPKENCYFCHDRLTDHLLPLTSVNSLSYHPLPHNVASNSNSGTRTLSDWQPVSCQETVSELPLLTTCTFQQGVLELLQIVTVYISLQAEFSNFWSNDTWPWKLFIILFPFGQVFWRHPPHRLLCWS